jgi:uncharacterized membrane protein
MHMVRFSEEKSERAIAVALRYGSLISTLVMALGLGLMLLRGSAMSLATYHRIRLSQLFSLVVRFDPAGLTELGVLLLLLTPLFRILVAIISFALERDLKYVLIALGVLSVVLLSISFAIEG